MSRDLPDIQTKMFTLKDERVLEKEVRKLERDNNVISQSLLFHNDHFIWIVSYERNIYKGGRGLW